MTIGRESATSGSVIAPRETASSPSVTADGFSISEPLHVALYVDGFNLYHAIDKLQQPHLKWLNLWALGERIIPRGQEKLVKVRYFTALKPGRADKNQRHREYISALKCYGVTIHEGHFINDEISCRKCGHTWDSPKEKESDANLALYILDDAYQALYKKAYVVTADSDHGATARLIKQRFPDLKFVSVVPPGMEASKSIMTHTQYRQKLTPEYLEDCLLPPHRIDEIDGRPTLKFRRPAEYATPAGWVAPSDRRRR